MTSSLSVTRIVSPSRTIRRYLLRLSLRTFVPRNFVKQK
jgi:hypothetical protein